MTEPRRVELTTISTTNGEKKEKKQPLTQRFTLALGESTTSTCPEFSFTELVKKEKKVPRSAAPDANPDDPFGDEADHDEVVAIARKFEEKYGPKPKKKLKCLEDEYYDLGEGYDENDPFIDNTEAYDEVVPSCLTTQHGGFYINRGTLDFRTLSEQEDSAAEFTPTAKKRGRPKKILDSESEQDDNGEPKKKKIKKKKLKEGLEGVEKKKKKKIAVGPDGEKIIRRRKPLDPDKKKKTSPTVAELLKQQTASTSATPNGNVDLGPGTPSLSTHDLQAIDKSTIQDRIEAMICEQLQDGQSQDKKANGGDSGPNNLPSDLPLELARTIDNIKQAAKDRTEGKCKFFSGNVNKMLLDIELGSRQLAFGKRSSIYAHLADHLPCGKETLIKRAKKLRESQQDDQLKGPIQKLKDAINEVMPALQEQHEQELLRYRMENKEKMEEGGENIKEEGANTESDDEEKAAGTGVGDGQTRRGNRGPRKKFKWMPEIKQLLCQIVRVKMQMFDTYRIRNQTAEEYLKTFLDNEIKPLWPQGWIQTRMLFKESRSEHGSWTNPLKPKKPVLVTKSTASPQPQVPASVSLENVLDVKQAKTGAGSAGYISDVIELSNDDDQPLMPLARKEAKVNTVPTILDIADEPHMLTSVDALNVSPNSVAAMAAATAAAVSAPRTQLLPGVGDRRQRENLVTEILKGIKPNSLGLPASGKPPSVHNTPSTPPASQGDPFLAEFGRYLKSRHGTPGSAGPSQLSTARQQIPQQLQSKTVSSSTGKPDSAGDGKSKQLSQIKWQMDGLLAEDKQLKLSPGAGLASGFPATSLASENASAQQVHYKKMYSILSEPTTIAQRSKGEKVRDEILSRIQAEMDAVSLPQEDHSRKATSGGVSPPSTKQQLPVYSGRQGHQSLPAAPFPAHTGASQRHSMGGTIPPAHRPPSSSYSQAASGSLKPVASLGSQMPLLSASGDRGGSSGKPSGASAYSPQQHSPPHRSPAAARSTLTAAGSSGRDSPLKKSSSKSSPTSGYASAAFQRNIAGQAAAKSPQANSGKVAGQTSPGQRGSAFTRQPLHGPGHKSPSSPNQTAHSHKVSGSSQASGHGMDGTCKMTASASPVGLHWPDKKLPGGGGSNVTGSGGAQRGMQSLYEQMENQMKKAALEQNLALNCLLPSRSPGLTSPWSTLGQPQVSPPSMSQSSGSQGEHLSSGKSLGVSPLPAHSSPVSMPSQGQSLPRQPADGSKPPHGY